MPCSTAASQRWTLSKKQRVARGQAFPAIPRTRRWGCGGACEGRGLEDAARRRLEAAIEEQAALLAQLAAIRQLLLRDMEALDRHEQELGKNAARFEGLPRSLVPGWGDWRAAHEAFPEAARPPLEDAAFEEFRQARPDLADQIREAVGTARDRLALAASELDLDTAMGGAGYMEEAGAWQLDADDFTNACGRDAVKGDLVYFSVGADSLPGSDGEVRVIAELVTRSAKMSDLDDPCTLEDAVALRRRARRANNGAAPHSHRGRLHARGPAPGGRRRGGAELGGRRAGMGTRGGAAGAVRGDP